MNTLREGAVHVAVRDAALSVVEAAERVAHPRAGGVVTFTGGVRDHDHGRGVTRLEYTAHPGAADALAQIAADIAARPGVVSVYVVHRTGLLEVGDLAVVVAVSAEHRDAAFVGARDLIDTLKEQVPIWKRQVFDDGTDEWVGTP